MTTQEQPQQQPPQENMDTQPLNEGDNAGGGYGSFMQSASPRFSNFHDSAAEYMDPKKLDAKLPKKMLDICNQWIVATDQLDEMENPGGALICARALRMFLIFFIVTSTIGLFVGFFLKASLSAPLETEQYGYLEAPSLVVCPSPWGSRFLGFDVQAAQKATVPGTPWIDLTPANWSVEAFNSTQAGDYASFYEPCQHIKLEGVRLYPRGKVARYSAFDTIRLTLNAQTEDGKFNFGLSNGDNDMPQRWSYGSLGNRITGEIQYDQVNIGASDVSEGEPRSILNFKESGSAVLGGTTEVEYFFGYFMVRVLSAQAKGMTVFAVVAFVLLVAAAVNNCGLFELFFREYIPDDEPPPALEPNVLCQAVMGRCCAACRRRKKEADPEEEAEAETTAAA